MTIASIRALAAARARCVTSCGRTSRPPSRLTGPTKPITNSLAGLVVDLARGADLLDLAAVHHRDPVGDLHRLLLIVGDEHGGDVLLVVQAPQPGAQLGADGGVERAERLVEQQHLRLDGERPGERHPLALAAGELVRALLGPLGQADQRQQLVDALA